MELTGREHVEFEPLLVVLPLVTKRRVDLLSKQIGVPASRLCAELLAACIQQAEIEWGMVDGSNAPAAAVNLVGKPPQVIPDKVRLLG